MNALKHGRETAERRKFRRRALRFLRLDAAFREAVLSGRDAGSLASELEHASSRLDARLEDPPPAPWVRVSDAGE